MTGKWCPVKKAPETMAKCSKLKKLPDSTGVRSSSNYFAALVNVNEEDVKATGDNLHMLDLDQNSFSSPAGLNLTSLGAQILKNMNPMHACTANLVQNPIAQHHKGVVDNPHVYKEESKEANLQKPHQIEEEARYKTWADQVEEDEDDFVDSLQDDNKEETYHVSNSYTSNDEAIKVQDEQATVLSSKRGLSPNAPAFAHTGQKQNTAVVLKDMSNDKDQRKAVIPGIL
ncbi:hypothetical protein A4A49_37372 [Nicotiana attenuata]|uniref:Uncharacterized protein n=1 Tax=Nicotiana attenuata TaxID=49451 RepID=A0A1J6KPK2_NICAT|nr:hypothetical protein A4A49_37372 [Nicotiana attenuata]